MAGGEGEALGAWAPRSTASQMQRGSGELQSTPTAFWKHHSERAGAGDGSMAAGIGAQSSPNTGQAPAHKHVHEMESRRPETRAAEVPRRGS